MKNIQGIRRVIQSMFLILFIMGIMSDVSAIKIGIIIIGVLGGAFYCGWICPFGMIQEVISNMGDKLGIPKKKISKKWHWILSKIRYLILMFVTAFSIWFIFEILSYDPRSNFLAFLTGREVGYGAIGVMIIFLAVSLFYERVFCNYLCMEGAKYGLMGIFRPFTVKRDKGNCVQCGKCSRICPMKIDVADMDDVSSLQCINCFKCVSSCPKEDTLKFGLRSFGKKKIKKTGIIALVAIILVGIKLIGGKHQHEPYIENEIISKDTVAVNDETKDPDKKYNNGTFNGVGRGFKGNMTAEVIIKDDIITSIEIIQNVDDRNWFNRANKVIPSEIIKEQSIEVDVVSGATYSSKGIINAVEDALGKAENR